MYSVNQSGVQISCNSRFKASAPLPTSAFRDFHISIVPRKSSHLSYIRFWRGFGLEQPILKVEEALPYVVFFNSLHLIKGTSICPTKISLHAHPQNLKFTFETHKNPNPDHLSLTPSLTIPLIAHLFCGADRSSHNQL